MTVGGDFDTLVTNLRTAIADPGIDVEYPALTSITSADFLRSTVENQQATGLDTRTETLRLSLFTETALWGVLDLLNQVGDYFILTDGQNLTYLTGTLDMKDESSGTLHRIQNLRDGEVSLDGVTKSQLDVETAKVTGITDSYGSSSDPNVVEKTGAYPMKADLSLGTRKAINVADITSGDTTTTGANKKYVSTAFTLSDSTYHSLVNSAANPRSATLDMSGHPISNLASSDPSTDALHLANVAVFQTALAGLGLSGQTEVAGLIRPYACLTSTSTPPPGYLFCDGSAYDNNAPAYSALYTILSNRFNFSTDQQTVFRVPDLRGRVVCGFDDMAGNAQAGVIDASWCKHSNGNMTPGVDGPGITRTNNPYKVNLPGGVSADATPSETHLVSTTELPTGHAHVGTNARYENPHNTGAVHIAGDHPPTTGTKTDWNDTTVSPTPSTSSVGGGVFHTNIQPTLALTWIISLG